MIGHHAAPFILDVYAKGYRDFDANEAYMAMRKNATEASMLPWRRGPLTSLDHVYFDKGFFPALLPGESETAPEVTPEKRQAVSVTLENSYDDWCVAQLAKALGKQSDAAYFGKLANNYRNLFDTSIGFMAPKSADGKWIAGFDPNLGGGQGGRDYFTEVNSWTYTFNVQHDPSGLIELFGGRDTFNAKLDQLFVEQYGTSKYGFLGQFPDATGLVGQYAQGNRPRLSYSVSLRLFRSTLENTASSETTDGRLVWRRSTGYSWRRRWWCNFVVVRFQRHWLLPCVPRRSRL